MPTATGFGFRRILHHFLFFCAANGYLSLAALPGILPITKQTKIDRYGEQGHALVYFGLWAVGVS